MGSGLSRDPIDRLEALLDTETLLITDKGDAVVCGRGRVDGVAVAAFATDPEVQGGALDAGSCQAIARTIERAAQEGSAVVGLWHSGGAKLQERVESLDGMGRIFAASTAASGRVPQISVVLGPAAGGAAYGTALTDVVIAAPDARMFVTGPAVVRAVTGQDLDAKALGSPEVHGRLSGLVHVEALSAPDALLTARRLVRLLAGPAHPAATAPPEPRLDDVVPSSHRRAYDVNALVRLLLDRDQDSVQLHPRWAPNVATWLGRMGGRTIGILANNPISLGGCLDALSADKAARFVRTCDSLGVPIVVVVDVPGYLPGPAQEWDGVIRRGAKLLHAFAESTVPSFTLITRKAYGGGYIAMNSKSLGADAVLAWPGAEIDVMGPEAAVQVLHRKALAALAPEDRAAAAAELVRQQQPGGGVRLALELGLVDRIVQPAETRTVLVELLAACGARRGRHGNIPL